MFSNCKIMYKSLTEFNWLYHCLKSNIYFAHGKKQLGPRNEKLKKNALTYVIFVENFFMVVLVHRSTHWFRCTLTVMNVIQVGNG